MFNFIVKKTKWNVSGLEGYQIQTERILLELKDSYDKLEFIVTAQLNLNWSWSLT
jgi:hypothetical protein